MRTFILSVLVVINLLPALTQENYTTKKKTAIKDYTEGIQKLNLKYYDKAIELFKKAISIDRNFIEAYLILAQAYEDNKEYEKAIETYKTGIAINPQFFPYSYIIQGNLEYKLGKYQDALHSYQAFLATGSKNNKHVDVAKRGIQQCNFSIDAVNHPVEFKPVNLGKEINTKYDEYWPCLTADENTLIFTRLIRDSMNYFGFQEDFFISTKENGNWGLAKNAGPPLNSPRNEGAQSISADGRYMVFTACGRKDGMGRCDLYFSKKIGDNWTVPKNIGEPVNTVSYETQPSLSADGKTLYFVTDRAEGFGDLDIYCSESDNSGNWSTPVNLGEMINTPGRDWAPFIHPDNQTLYFASNDRIGLGGFDLYMSRKDSSGKWSEPVNLGYPINTNNDEYGLILNAGGTYALYSSDRDSADGRDLFRFDMYKAARPNGVSYMKGKVFDAETRQLLGARFELIDLKTNQVINNSMSDSITGEFLVCIPVHHDYLLNVSKSGYLFYSDNFPLDSVFEVTQPFLKDIPLQSIGIGKSVILKNIFYEFDSYKLKDESRIELDKLVHFLKTYPGIKIEVVGHTDSLGTAEYNKTLSAQRAKSVADYLIASSISKDRIQYKGMGFSQPIAPNQTEEGRAQNRRTELIILEK